MAIRAAMNPEIKTLAFGALMVLFSLTAFAYLRAMRRWLGRLREVAVEDPTPEGRARFMQTDEYRRLRLGLGRPLLAATVLVAALLLLTRLP
jgi:hypothetical protein